MINAVLFDLDGTLLDRDSSLIVFLHRQWPRCADLLAGIDPIAYRDRVIDLDAHGYTPKDLLFQQIEAEFALPVGSWQTLLADFQTNFPDTCVPFPRLHQTLAHLAARDFALGLITNGSSAAQNPKIDGLGIRAYFPTLLISEAEGIRKPDPAIFHRALQQLDVSAAQALFVGDNPQADIQAAQAVGMRAVWMEDAYWPRPAQPDAIITGLAQLPAIVDAWNQNESLGTTIA